MSDKKRPLFEGYPLVLKVKHVAEILGISRAKAYQLVKEHGFPAIRISRRICVPRYAFERWVEEKVS